MERFFASDHHLWHHNIIRYSSRPFANVKEMNDALLTYHNERVKPNDHCSFLGDITMMRGGRTARELFISELKKYNGHLRLYLGNHDHFPVKVYLDAGFEKILATWRDEEGLLFSHFPLHPRSLGSAVANIHGHTHANPNYDPVMSINQKTQEVYYQPYINISVEQTEYKPISIDEIKQRIRKANNE